MDGLLPLVREFGGLGVLLWVVWRFETKWLPVLSDLYETMIEVKVLLQKNNREGHTH